MSGTDRVERGKVVALVPDLMDRSRLGGHTIEFVNAPALLPVVATGAHLVLVDLSRPGVFDVLDAVVDGADRVVGFAPHVEDEALALATGHGVEAMARSVFFRRVDELLAAVDGD
jgi:hypothetical protein